MSAAVVVGVVLAGVSSSCSNPAKLATASGCPEGTTRWGSINEIAEGAPTREDAVRAELQNLDMEASDAAVDEALIASSPGDVGAEKVEVQTSEGVAVTMTLTPLDRGWGVEGSTWCAPDQA